MFHKEIYCKIKSKLSLSVKQTLVKFYLTLKYIKPKVIIFIVVINRIHYPVGS